MRNTRLIIYDKCSHEQFWVKMPGVKHGRQSFTFEYKLKVIARADNFVSSWISFVFGCGLSASVGNLLKFLLLQKMTGAGNLPRG